MQVGEGVRAGRRGGQVENVRRGRDCSFLPLPRTDVRADPHREVAKLATYIALCPRLLGLEPNRAFQCLSQNGPRS